MPTIIFDADFLSSFLKIERCELVRTFYQVEQALVPAAVYREIAQTDLLRSLLAIPWIHIPSTGAVPDEGLPQDPTFQMLGAGERGCITLARAQTESVVLMSDNKARRFAQSLGIKVVNIPAFLFACKMADLVSPQQMAAIIQELKDKDFYDFRADVRTELLR